MQAPAVKRIGILGGTFNPIHLGHLILGRCAVENFELSKVLLIPCAVPPHKDPNGLVSAVHRLAMIELAIEGDLCFEASAIEIERGGVSYAVDTVAALHDLHPDSELYFIIGSDTLTELHLWKNVYTLLPFCRFVTFVRPGSDLDAMKARNLHLTAPWPERLMKDVTRSRQIDISSSDIRHRVAEGLSIRYLVPPAVEMYIAEHNLYSL